MFTSKFDAVRPRRSLKHRLLLAVSVGALTTAAPSIGVYGYGRARAQVLDAGCTDQGGSGTADAGDTVTCVAPPNPIEDVIANVDDLTIVIGDGATATTITSNAAGTTTGVSMVGGGDQRLEITSSGRVEGDANSTAVQVITASGSAVVVNYGAIYSSGARGLNVTVAPGGTDLTIVSDGSVEAGSVGIYARAYGSGALSVSANDVTGNGGNGIEVLAGASTTGLTVDVSGTVIGQGVGVQATNFGAGDTSITLGSSASITGQNGYGILGTTAGGTTTVQGSSGAVTGSSVGINLASAGGEIVILSLDGITGQAGDAVNLRSNGGNITISDVGTILGTGGDGIDVQSGAGDISIQGVGLVGGVTGTSGQGIRANSTGGDIGIGDVTAVGNVTGSQNGIAANITAGSGAVTVDTSAGTVTGNNYGIRVESLSTGGVSVTTANVQSTNERAILINNYTGGSVVVNTVAGTINANHGGVYVDNYGAATSITTADINTTNRAAIEAYNAAGSTSLTIDSTAGTLVGNTGIFAVNSGTGDTTITTADVTGTGYIGIEARIAATGDLVIDTSAGTVSAAYQGILVYQNGSGDTSMTVGDVGGNTGIDVRGSTGATVVTLTSDALVTGQTGAAVRAQSASGGLTVQGSSGDLIGATDGVNLTTTGGAIIVQNLDSITGQAGDGVRASSGGGDITVSNVDTILGTGGDGIDAQSGSGDISIQGAGLVGGVTGTGGNGILAGATTGDIDIGGTTAVGDVSGSVDGIYAQTTGGGDITIRSTGAITGGVDGITARTDGGSNGNRGDVDIDVVDVDGTGIGIEARARGAFFSNTPTISITSTGTIGGSGTLERGIAASSPRGVSVDMDVVNVYSTTGIAVSADINQGGAISLTSTGTIASAGSDGVRLSNLAGSFGPTYSLAATVNNVSGGRDGLYLYSYGSGVDVAVTGTIAGGRDGIRLDNQGNGISRITLGPSASVTGQGGEGIHVSNDTLADGIIVQGSSGSVIGSTTGLLLTSSGDDITVQNLDSITGQAGDGVRASSGGGDITVSNVDTILGSDDGIDVQSSGGDISIQGVGLVGGVTGAGRDGINASSGTGALDIGGTTAVGDVTGSRYGIYAQTTSGDITIASTGTVSGGSRIGIYAFTTAGGDIGIDVATVRSTNRNGISAYSTNGDVHVTAANVIAGEIGIGATASGGGSVTIDAGNVSADNNHAIIVNKGGGGATTITTSGTVTSLGADGIRTIQGGTGGLSVTVNGTVTGATRGIQSNSIGAGTAPIEIELGASASVTGQGSDGIYTGSIGAAAHTVTGASGTSITSATRGIGMQSGGASDLTIQDVTTIRGNGGDAVHATTAGGTITISNVGTILGIGGDGIDARSNGGDISIQGVGLVGGVAGTSGAGITVQSGAGDINIGGITAIGGATGLTTGFEAQGSGDITISSTGVVEGGTYGIYSRSAGTGTTTINVYTVTGGDTGIDAYNAFGGADLSVTSTGTVAGATGAGINAISAGTGALTVTAATVTGGGYDGIYVNQSPAGASTSVTATGPVIGNESGVYMLHYGTDAATVSVSDATGTTYAGVFVYSSPTSTGLTITSTGTASGGTDGIVGFHYGTGNVTVQANNVSATANDGIAVTNAATGNAMSIITSGAVAGGDEGIDATSFGTGGMSVIATGPVSGGDQGVQARNYGAGPMVLSLGPVTGAGDDAVEVYNSAAGGAVSLTTTGTVLGADDGLDVVNFGSSVTISIAGGQVTGGDAGIEVYNYAATTTHVSIASDVTGQTGAGVALVTVSGATVDVASGTITGGNGVGISLAGAAAADTLSLAAGTAVNGLILLNGGNDTFNDASGVFTAAEGGAGTDTLNFLGGARIISGSGAAGDTIREFEVFNFNTGGFTLAGTHTGLTSANFNTGLNTLMGTLVAGDVTIAPGAELAAADASAITGNLANAGTLRIGNSPGTVTVNGNFTQTATGTLPIEIGASHDQLIVTGDVALDGTLDISLLAGVGAGTTARRIIDGGGTLTGNFASVTGNNGLLITNQVTQDVPAADVFVITTVRDASSVAGLTQNQVNAGNNLIGQLTDPGANPGLVALANAIGVTADPQALAARLHELGPEVVDLGLKFLAMAQDRFTRQMLDQAVPDVAGAPAAGEARVATAPGGAKVWGTISGSGVTQHGGNAHSDFDGALTQFATGMSGIQVGGADSGMTAGFAAGVTTFDAGTDNGILDGSVLGDNATGEIAHVGATLFADGLSVGEIDLTAGSALSLSTGSQHVDMNFTDPVSGGRVQQSGDADFTRLDLTTRLAATGNGGEAWPVQPFIEAGVSKTWQQGFSIKSGNAAALDIEDLETLSGKIGIGLTYTHQVAEQTTVNARVAGFQFFGDTQNKIDARFSSASSGGAFTTTGKDWDQQVLLDAGLTHRFESGVTLNVKAFSELGDVTSHGASVNLSVPF